MRNEKIFRGYWIAIISLIVGLLLFSTVAHAALKTLINPVVVRVNGEALTETEFLYFLLGKYGDDVVDQLVENLVLTQEAAQFGLELDPQDGWDFLNRNYDEEKLAALRKAFDLDVVAASLAREGLALKVVNKKSEQLIEEYGIEVTDEEILQFYLDNIDNLIVPERARFSWIVLSDRSTADKALKRLDDGDDFAAVAKEMSVDETTKDEAGEVGIAVKGETKGLPPVIADTVFSLSEGEYSEIVEFGENFFIVLTNEKHKAYEPSLEELGPLIETKLLTQRLEGPLGLWLKGLSDKSEIEIVYPIFKEMDEPGLMVPEGE